MKTLKKINRLMVALLKTILTLLILVIAVCLIFNQSIANHFVQSQSEEYFNKVPIVTIKESKLKKIVKAKDDPNLYNPDNISALQTTDLIGKSFDHLNPHAKIVIPSIGMNLPIFHGLTNENLMVGAGTMKPDQTLGEGNYALASHSVFSGYNSESLLFSPLHRASASDTVFVIENKIVYRYKITDIFEVTPDSGYVIDDVKGENLLTLVTCTDMNATKRLIVQARFVQEYPIEEAPSVLTSYL